MADRKEVPEDEQRSSRTFNLAPTGHKVPEGRSPDDPSMAFRIPDCGVKAGGQFMSPFVSDPEDLPNEDDCKNHQGS